MTWIQHYAKPGLPDEELRDHICRSHLIVARGLPKKKQAELGLKLLTRDKASACLTGSRVIVIARGKAPKRSRSREPGTTFRIATAAMGRLAMTPRRLEKAGTFGRWH